VTGVRGRRRPGLWAVLVTAALVVVAGIATSQASMAYWNSQESTSGVTLQAGTADLVVTGVDEREPELYPGASATLAIAEVANTGDVDLDLSLTFGTRPTALEAAATISAWRAGTSSCDGPPDAPSSAAAGQRIDLGRLEPTGTAYLCLGVVLAPDAGAELQDEPDWFFDVTVDGRQP
jgi:predicted ribosomally synthesized peptide with SipW-like signal peptide